MKTQSASNPSKALSRTEWRVILLTSLGGALEYYDFILYGVFAAYIGQTFFPESDPFISLLLAFGVFTGGYFVRPIGGLILGHYGDRFGRRKVLIFSIFLMSLSTLATAALPGHETLGVTASILMIALRLLQGFSLGGELPGAITYVAEAAPHRRGLACGIIILFINSGVLLAALVSLALHAVLSADAMASWGWRLGFALGGILGFLSFWLRLSLEETEEFQRIKSSAPRLPIAELISAYPWRIATGVAALAAPAGFNGLMFAHMPSYLTQVLGYKPFDAMLAQNLCLVVLSVSIIIAGWASDFITRRYVLGAGAALFVMFSWPFYFGLQTHPQFYLILMAAAAFAASLCNGTFAVIAAELFPAHLRFSGVGAALNLSTSLLGGTAPLIASALIAGTGEATSPAFIMIACGVLTLLSLIGLRRFDRAAAANKVEMQLAPAGAQDLGIEPQKDRTTESSNE